MDGITGLEVVNMRINQMSGTIPPSFYEATNMRVLYLSKNNFTGTVSSAIGNLSRLKDLWLDSNLFSGTIPPEIGNDIEMGEFLFLVDRLAKIQNRTGPCESRTYYFI